MWQANLDDSPVDGENRWLVLSLLYRGGLLNPDPLLLTEQPIW